MKRHRTTFDPTREEPFEVSRSQIESFLRCPACYWMLRRKGIKFPGMPGFLLNTATDTLLKKDFDKYRELQQPHPFMERNGLGHLVPFQHEDFETWTKSLQLGLRTLYEPANLIVGVVWMMYGTTESQTRSLWWTTRAPPGKEMRRARLWSQLPYMGYTSRLTEDRWTCINGS